MPHEAELDDQGAGLQPVSDGWFVVNARDARWFARPGRGDGLPLTGCDAFEAESFFPMLGMAIHVLAPGEPNATYHWETEQEGFLVLEGSVLLVVEGEERLLERWDFVHCPPGTRHVFVGAGAGPSVLLAASSRQFQEGGPWGRYCADPVAARHGAAAPAETQDPAVAYARYPPVRPVRYRDGLLPG